MAGTAPKSSPAKPVKSPKKNATEEPPQTQPAQKAPEVQEPVPAKVTKPKPVEAPEKPAPVKRATKKAPEPVEEVDSDESEEEAPVPAPKKAGRKPAVKKADGEEDAPKQPRKRQPVTVDRVVKLLEENRSRVQDEIDALEGQKVKHRSILVKDRKGYEDVVKLLNRLPKGRRRATTSDDKPKVVNSRSGLNRAHQVTDSVAKFLSVDAGSSKTRSDLTKAICGYVRDNSLQMAEKKTRFRLDDKLRTILPLQFSRETRDKQSGGKKTVNYDFDHDGMSYTELQVVLNQCFVPEPVVEKPAKAPKAPAKQSTKGKKPATKAVVEEDSDNDDEDSEDGGVEVVDSDDD